MKKSTAIELLGGKVTKVARHLGCSTQAVYAWPDPLPRKIADRVLAAVVRHRAELLLQEGAELHPLEQDAIAL